MSATLTGFAPIARSDARVLVLGSMPGVASLAAAQYYGHPRNAFWPIMGELVGAFPELTYAQRTLRLRQHGIAVWDVLQHCRRPGSLDQRIETETMVANDFASFFTRHTRVGAVFCNGSMAEQTYRRQVIETLAEPFRSLPLARLPSTSPAHAARSLEQKLSAWRALEPWLIR